MQVIDLASNELLCELEVKRCALGKPDYTERTAFVNAHSGYAEYLQELVKKNKLKSDGAKTGIIVNRVTKTNINQASGSNTTKTVESKPVDKDEREAEVVLKSGTVIKGKMQSMDLENGIVLIIAGQPTTIPMSEVKEVK